MSCAVVELTQGSEKPSQKLVRSWRSKRLDQQISRRKLFRNSALLGAGILLGYGASGVKILNAEEAQKAAELDAFLYIKICPDNTVHLIVPNTEIGQGIHTAQAIVIAEELELDLNNVVVSDAPPLPEYGKFRTGGSISINKNFDKLIKIGATAKEMLVEAASLEWQVARDESVAKDGYVSHISSGRSVSYRELTEKASSSAPPQDPIIKKRKEYQLAKIYLKLIYQTRSTDLLLMGWMSNFLICSSQSSRVFPEEEER